MVRLIRVTADAVEDARVSARRMEKVYGTRELIVELDDDLQSLDLSVGNERRGF